MGGLSSFAIAKRDDSPECRPSDRTWLVLATAQRSELGLGPQVLTLGVVRPQPMGEGRREAARRPHCRRQLSHPS